MKSECKTNIYRQVFILLLALFDSTLTDYFIYLLNNSFFEVVQYAQIDKNYKIKDMLQFTSMEEFKEKMINDIVESKKAHAILKVLVEYKPDLFDFNGKNIKDDIFEIIGRRNIHVHKKGIVDVGYLQQSNGNPYGFSIGDYCAIDSVYFNKCYELLHLFVDNWN